MAVSSNGMRARLGCWLHERWQAERVMARWLPSALRVPWVDLCNRRESLTVGSDSDARLCMWDNSSYLTVAKVFPEVGARLYRHCSREHPISLEPAAGTAPVQVPARMAVVIPFGGSSRVRQLLAVLHSLDAQDTREFEIILVGEGIDLTLQQQAARPNLRAINCDSSSSKFPKSRYLNVGVEAASAPLVLLHDADIPVPRDFVRSVTERLERGWEAVHPIRLLFYFDEPGTEAYLASDGRVLPSAIREIRTNFAGGSIALSRDAFRRIGGMNENFVGWGLEDVEFLQRASTTRMFRGRFMPAAHLWHPAERDLLSNPNVDCLRHLEALPVQERIRMLTARASGARERGPGAARTWSSLIG